MASVWVTPTSVRGRLKPGEAAGAVAHAADRARGEPLAQRVVTGWKRKMWPTWSTRPVSPTIAASRRPSSTVRVSGFSMKQSRPARRHSPGQGQMAVGRRHDVDRVHVGQRAAEILHRARGGHPRLHRERPALGGDVGHPQLHPQLSEHAQVLLAPAAQADQQHLHRGSPPSRPRPPRSRSGAADPSSSGPPAGPRTRAAPGCRCRTWTRRSDAAGGSPAPRGPGTRAS